MARPRKLFPLTETSIETFYHRRGDIALPHSLAKDPRHKHYCGLLSIFPTGERIPDPHDREFIERTTSFASEGLIDCLGLYTLEERARSPRLPSLVSVSSDITQEIKLLILTLEPKKGVKQESMVNKFQKLFVNPMYSEEPLLKKIELIKIDQVSGHAHPADIRHAVEAYMQWVCVGRLALAKAYTR